MKINIKFALAIILCFCVYYLPVHAQIMVDSCQSDILQVFEDSQQVFKDSQGYMENQIRVEEAKVNYKIFALNHAKCLYKFQFIMTIVIFILVLAIVAFGMYLSYLQFSKDYIKDNEKSTATNLKIGLTQLEISSNIIGLVILVISLAFFFIFVTKIYEITDINNPKSLVDKVDKKQ